MGLCAVPVVAGWSEKTMLAELKAQSVLARDEAEMFRKAYKMTNNPIFIRWARDEMKEKRMLDRSIREIELTVGVTGLVR